MFYCGQNFTIENGLTMDNFFELVISASFEDFDKWISKYNLKPGIGV